MNELIRGYTENREKKSVNKLRKLSRRDFLKVMLNGGAGIGLSMLGIPVSAHTDEGQIKAEGFNVTERERIGFSYPEDIHGNESFWGNDILITIDDCANLDQTRKMFDLLNDRGLKATFFPNSNYLSLDNNEFTALWREMYRAGMEIGYHTQSHEVQEFNQNELSRDLEEFENHMRFLLDDVPFSIKFARPPYGYWNDTWMNFVREEQLSNIRWNFVPDSGSNSISYFEAVTKHTQGGRIILLHPRVWDGDWLESHIDELLSFANSEQGRITTLSGNQEGS